MAETVIMPKLGFDMAEGTLVRWVIQEGQPVGKGAVLAEIETDKATVEVESGYEGILARHMVAQGDIVPVNTAIAIITAPGETLPVDAGVLPVAASASTQMVETQVAQNAGGLHAAAAPAIQEIAQIGEIKASPLARKLAIDAGLDLSQVPGTGPGGRVIKRDIVNYKVSPPAAAPAAEITAPHTSVHIFPAADAGYDDQRVPLTRLRQAIGRRMVEAKTQLPHFYVTHEFDVTALIELRKQVNSLLSDEAKTSVNDYLVRGAALTLREFPNLNASLAGDVVLRHGQVNVGVAVAVEGGLLTVVSKNTDQKSVRMISSEVKAMAERARAAKVRTDDIEGSTFSISNLGMFDVENFIAIINPPEAAILAVGSAREVPVVKNGAVVPGWRMKATISVDHRVSDGAEAARFMQTLAKYIEQPMSLLI